MRSLFFLAALALLAVAVLATEPLKCPRVLDGLSAMGDYDLQEQQATSVIAAHWRGLADSEVLAYEYAVVSEKLVNADLADAACRTAPGFVGVPDVVDWKFTRKQKEFANAQVSLQLDTQYYVIVRTILSNGQQVYSSSNGVRVVPPMQASDDFAVPPTRLEEARSRSERSTLDPVNAVNLACPIDAANRCRQSAKTPGALLTEIYGPPQFSNSGQINTLFIIPTTAQDALNVGMDPLDSRQAREARGLAGDQQVLPEYSSDDDDWYEPVLPGVAIAGIVVPITVGTMVLMALVALLAWLFASSGGRDIRSGSRVVSAAPASTGAAPAAAPAAPNDTVRMDFPDLDVRS